jgi:CheY-like chemotaxis protein
VGSGRTKSVAQKFATRVLVVDDDAETRTALRALLSNADMKVEVAGSVSEAIDAVSRFSPRVVVSDLAMPEEDGFDLIHRIRSEEKQSGGHITAVAMTGLEKPNVREEALEAGFDAFFSKPVNLARLVETIRLVEP